MVNKQRQILTLLGTLFLLTGAMRYNKDYMAAGWYFGVSAFCALTSFFVGKKLGRLAGFSFCYFGLNAIYTAMFRGNHFSQSPHLTRFFISANALEFFAAMVVFLSFIFLFSKWDEQESFDVFDCFGIVASIDIGLVLSGFIFGFGKLQVAGVGGLFDNPSTNACFIAVATPFLVRCFHGVFKHSYLLFILPLIAIALSKASIPYGALFLSVAGLCLTRKQAPKIILALVVLLVVGLLVERQGLFYSSGRFEAYGLFMGEWLERLNILTGTGPGTFFVLGPEIQIKHNYLITSTPEHGVSGQFFTWMHSDWLQVMFENGIIGFFLCLLLYLKSLFGLFRVSRYEFAALLSFGGVALFNYPTRYFLFAALGASLLIKGLLCAKNPNMYRPNVTG